MKHRLRGACIGYGFISEGGHSPSYRLRSDSPGDFEIVAVADITPARRAAAAKSYPRARIYESWERLLDKESRNVDFVDITTPPYAHAEIAHAALDCRLHVLCEKPLAASMKQSQLMAVLAANLGVLWVAMEAATLTTVLLVSVYRTAASLEWFRHPDEALAAARSSRENVLEQVAALVGQPAIARVRAEV